MLASVLPGVGRARLMSLALGGTVGLVRFTCVIVWWDSLVWLQTGFSAIVSSTVVSPEGGAALVKSRWNL